MCIQDSLCGMLRMIRVDTLRRGHYVGFVAGRLSLIDLRHTITDVSRLTPFPHVESRDMCCASVTDGFTIVNPFLPTCRRFRRIGSRRLLKTL